MVTNSLRSSSCRGAAQAGISKSSCQVAYTEQPHFKPYRPTLVVDLNEDDFDRRSEFCEIWLEKFEYDPDLLIVYFRATRPNSVYERNS